MATVYTTQCAIEVVNLLNGAPSGSFSLPTGQTFSAVRRYAPLNKRESLSSLTVSVVSKDQDRTFATRGSGSTAPLVDKEISVDVAIQKALVKVEDLTELDGMMLLVNSVILFLEKAISRNLPCGASLMRVENKPIYDPKHLMELQVFTSLITLHFEVTD